MHPLVVSYGVGLDSTAVLCGLQQRGIRPDAILTADTGGEKRETYAYLPVIKAWLDIVGFPPVTLVRYVPKTAPYTTLEGKCLANETLPSLAYGMHSCALKFKVEPQDKWLQQWQPAIQAWAEGRRVTKAIGYDNGPQDCRRRAKADRVNARKAERGERDAKRFDYWYPLQEWGVDRRGCEALIRAAGLPLPVKSACWFCPASKKSEVIWLRDTHPDLFERALAMEEVSRTGRHGFKSIKGLGRNFAWSDLAQAGIEDIGEEVELLRP